MNLHCHNERNVFSMWIHSEFDDKKDQVWHFQFYQIMFYHQSRLNIGQSRRNFLSTAELSTPTRVSSLRDPAEVIMWIQLISINKLLIWVMTCLQRSRLSVLGSGWTLCTKENIVLTQTLQILLIKPKPSMSCLLEQKNISKVVGKAAGLKKKARLVKHNCVL